MDLDPRMGDDPVNQVAGHLLGQVVAADDQADDTAFTGEEKRRLPGRVGPADYRHFRTAARARFQFGGRVVDTGVLELRPPLQRELPVASPAGHYYSVRRHLRPGGQRDHELAVTRRQRARLARAI